MVGSQVKYNRFARRMASWMKPRITAILDLLDTVFCSPQFAVILALVLFVFGTAAAHPVILLAIGMAFLIVLVCFARSPFIKGLGVTLRICSLIFVTAFFIFLIYWANHAYDSAHAGRLHVLGFTPVAMSSGQNAEIDIYYENSGDSSLRFRMLQRSVLLPDILSLSKTELDDRIKYAHAGMTYVGATSMGTSFAVTPHYGEHMELKTQIVDQRVIDLLNSGEAVFLTVGIMRYAEPKNHPDVEFCILWDWRNHSPRVEKCPTHNWE